MLSTEHNMNNNSIQIIKWYLEKLWLQDKQSEIFLMVYQYWPKPASTIANLAKTERSYCYKVLEDMVREWYIDQIISLWIKQYYINSIDSLQKTIEKKEQEVKNLKEEFILIQWEFKELDKQKSPYIPKIQQFQDREGIKKRYEDIERSIVEQWVIIINACFTSNFHSHVDKFQELQWYYDTLIQFIEKNKIQLSGSLWLGTLITEKMHIIRSTEDLTDHSIGNQSVQLWIIWEYVYLGMFRELPIGLKIKSPDMSDLLQTLLSFIH